MAFAKKIYRLQNLMVRKLNDMHIFVEQATPLLLEGKRVFENSKKNDKDRRYYVPYPGREKFARRTDKELKGIYDYYLYTGLFEALLASALSVFETFLSDALLEFFLEHPLRITQSVQRIPPCPTAPIKDVINTEDKETLLRSMIREHLSNVFRQRPSDYMNYFCTIVGIETSSTFDDFYEIAARRDLVVHNNGIVNLLYLEKSGKQNDVAVGQRLNVDKKYFEEALAKMKRISGRIKGQVEKKYGVKPN